MIPRYKRTLEDKIIIQDILDKWKKWLENRMQLCKYSCKAGTYNSTITRWEQLSRQQFCRERYRATVNHRLHESTILGWCRNGKHRILVKKSEYYASEIWNNFSNLPCTGNRLAGALDLDLSTELMQTNHRKKLHEKPTIKPPKPIPNKEREQKSLTYKKKSLFCVNNITDIAFIIWKVLWKGKVPTILTSTMKRVSNGLTM